MKKVWYVVLGFWGLLACLSFIGSVVALTYPWVGKTGAQTFEMIALIQVINLAVILVPTAVIGAARDLNRVSNAQTDGRVAGSLYVLGFLCFLVVPGINPGNPESVTAGMLWGTFLEYSCLLWVLFGNTIRRRVARLAI